MGFFSHIKKDEIASGLFFPHKNGPDPLSSLSSNAINNGTITASLWLAKRSFFSPDEDKDILHFKFIPQLTLQNRCSPGNAPFHPVTKRSVSFSPMEASRKRETL